VNAFTAFAGRSPANRPSFLAAAADAVAVAGRALLSAWREACEIKHLESLSDAHLRDIGITRSEIALVVRGTDIDEVRGRHVLD
jgi:uncharacterized protein YjiS (DUF1127 family)